MLATADESFLFIDHQPRPLIFSWRVTRGVKPFDQSLSPSLTSEKSRGFVVEMASADLSMSPPADAEGAMSAGEFVLKKLFAEFVALSERKLQNIATQPLV